MASTGHILLGNHEVIHTNGSAPITVVYGGHTLRTALGISIPKFTYIGGPVPSLATSHGQIFNLRSQMPVAQGEFTLGMASTSHILLGSCKVIHDNVSTPITCFYPI